MIEAGAGQLTYADLNNQKISATSLAERIMNVEELYLLTVYFFPYKKGRFFILVKKKWSSTV